MELSYRHILSQPVSIDWYFASYTYYEFPFDGLCECGVDSVIVNGCCSDCSKEHKELTGPMMNYVYPLMDSYKEDSIIEEAANKIRHLPFCIVEYINEADNETLVGFACTGAGEDFSWQICEAYICLGLYPPVWFAEVPALASYPKEKEAILRACKESLNFEKEKMEIKLQRLSLF